ncbi:MAG: hypothetical protein EU535_07130 [Promethearchaeota archaeon]|nr:MAG: hypothetical protein EU535_07130 [Candidatus Lokiarchaeota archaeon]
MKNKNRFFTITILTFTFFIIIAPMALAKTRSAYLIDYIYSNQGVSEDSGELFGLSYEDTAQSLEILKYYNAFTIEGILGVENKVDKVELSDYLEEELVDIFDSKTVLLYDVYNILKSLNLIDSSIGTALSVRIERYLNSSSHNSGGFSPINTSNTRDLTSTFYAYKIYDLLGAEFPNSTIHKNWIFDCYNFDGGFGGNSTLPSTILTTYYAIVLISELDDLDSLNTKSITLDYLSSFYMDNEYDSLKYGGYLPATQSTYPLLSSTFLCTTAIDYINSARLNRTATVNWVIDRQNFQDGGFSDIFSLNNQESSSIPGSYYAFKTLELFDAQSSLNQNDFMVEFDFFVLLIVFSVFGALVILAYVIWRKRKI